MSKTRETFIGPDQVEGDKSMIPLKQWVHEEAQRAGTTDGAIRMRLSRGQYPGTKLRRDNNRVVYVLKVGTYQRSRTQGGKAPGKNFCPPEYWETK